MNRDHIRPILIALALALTLVSLSLGVGLRNGASKPMWAICEDLGYPASDSGLAQCADTIDLPCGSPYVDHLRENC